MTANRENYYLLLGLDPDRDTTWAAIEPVLKRKRSEWSMPHPTRGLEYQRNRKSLPDMKRVLWDEALRREEADQARKLLRDAAPKSELIWTPASASRPRRAT